MYEKELRKNVQENIKLALFDKPKVKTFAPLASASNIASSIKLLIGSLCHFVRYFDDLYEKVKKPISNVKLVKYRKHIILYIFMTKFYTYLINFNFN